MRTKAISVTIAEPCTQNWDLMEDRNSERFCETCQKCVIDFTAYSNAEIVKVLKAAKNNICGRLKVAQMDQLNYYLIVQPSNKNWLKYLGVLAIGASLFVGEAKALNTKPGVEILASPAKNNGNIKPLKLKKIYGYVIDEGNKPIAGVRVVITNTNLFATTDKDGRYEIILKNDLNASLQLINVESMRYKASAKLNYAVEKQADLKLKSIPIIMGKIVMVNKN